MSRKYRNSMSMRWTRRNFIATAAVLVNGCDSNSPIFTTTSEVDPSGLPEQLAIDKTWTTTCDQAWVGQEFWSNRLADWHVHQGRLSTRNETSSMRKRTVSLLSVAVAEVSGSFSLSVLTAPHTFSNDSEAYSGFLIGAGSNVDYRAAALIHNRHGIDGGLIIGMDNAGRPFIHDNDVANQRLTQGPAIGGLTDSEATNGLRLQLDTSTNEDDSCSLNVFVTNDENEILSSTTTTIKRDRLLGHMALVANPGSSETGHWFNELKGSGDMLTVYPEREFGPILFASYTISRKVLTVNVQLPPLCLVAWNDPRIEAQTVESTWVTLAAGTIDPLSWTSRIQLNTESLTDYEAIRIAVDESVGPEIIVHTFELSVPSSEPKNEPSVIGLLSCRPSIILDHTEGWIQSHNQRPFTWNGSRLGFPHAELVDNLEKQQPDLLAFVGDQIYEFDPNGIVDKSSTSAQIEDYLWKWFQFGWSVRHLLRKTPAFMLPDDHDVFQANIWGASGRPAVNEVDGGFVYSAEFVNVVQRTQVGSLPDGFDDSAVEQGIGVYYTDIVYRNLGIAILEDRF